MPVATTQPDKNPCKFFFHVEPPFVVWFYCCGGVEGHTANSGVCCWSSGRREPFEPQTDPNNRKNRWGWCWAMIRARFNQQSNNRISSVGLRPRLKAREPVSSPVRSTITPQNTRPAPASATPTATPFASSPGPRCEHTGGCGGTETSRSIHSVRCRN